MRCVVIGSFGAPEVLRLTERSVPVAGPGEIRVAVAACGVNRADLLQRRGQYPAPAGVPADIPGLEYAGVVESVGAGVTAWHAGDRVMGLLAGGGYAERVVTHADVAMRVPDSLTLVEAAAIPEVFITAHDALSARLQASAGERVLIHAVGSGVGTAALQLAKAMGAITLGTSRSPDKLARARELGLDHAIVARDGWTDEVLRTTEGAGVDAIVDLAGGGYLDDNLRVLVTLGRIVVVGLLTGSSAELDLSRLMRKRATLIGTVLRARPHAEKIEATRAFERGVMPLLESGRVRPLVDRVFALDDAVAAHAYVESNASFGKVVLTMEGVG